VIRSYKDLTIYKQGIEMNLLYEIESLRYLNEEQEIWDKIDQIEMNLNPKDLMKAIDYFISHLSPEHNLSGKTYETLCGIGNWDRENNHLTHKQIIFAVMSMADNWNQLI
jgi:hypothetical protein